MSRCASIDPMGFQRMPVSMEACASSPTRFNKGRSSRQVKEVLLNTYMLMEKIGYYAIGLELVYIVQGAAASCTCELGKSCHPIKIETLGTQSDKSFLSGIEVATRKTGKRKRELNEGAMYPHRRQPRVKQHSQQHSLFNHPALGGLSNIRDLNYEGDQEALAAGRRAPNRLIVANRDMEARPSHIQWLLDTFGNNATDWKKWPSVANAYVLDATPTSVCSKDKDHTVAIAVIYRCVVGIEHGGLMMDCADFAVKTVKFVTGVKAASSLCRACRFFNSKDWLQFIL